MIVGRTLLYLGNPSATKRWQGLTMYSISIRALRAPDTAPSYSRSRRWRLGWATGCGIELSRAPLRGFLMWNLIITFSILSMNTKKEKSSSKYSRGLRRPSVASPIIDIDCKSTRLLVHGFRAFLSECPESRLSTFELRFTSPARHPQGVCGP